MRGKTQFQFLQGFLSALIALLLAAVVINIVIDPFDIFNAVTIPSINKKKTEIKNYLRLAKSIATCKAKPNAIILGSSRVELGIDPMHPKFIEKGLNAYNLGLSATNIKEVLYALKHAYYAAEGTLKVAVIGLDHTMFLANYDVEREGVSNNKSKINDVKMANVLVPPYYCEKYFSQNIDYFLFNKGLVASYFTFNKQKNKKEEDYYLRNGQRDPIKNPLNKQFFIAGHRALFASLENEYLRKMYAIPDNMKNIHQYKDGTTTFDVLREIINFSRENSIELKIFLSPTHGHTLNMLKEAGFWETIESFKRGVVEVLFEDANQFPETPILLWDFMSYDAISKEVIPKDIKKTMLWFWEGSHYKKATGDLVLDKIWGGNNKASGLPLNFGALLNKDNIEVALNELRSQAIQYEQQFPKDIIEIKKLIENRQKFR